MLVVRVELWSAVTGQKSEIARMQISNVGGSATLGDYHAASYRGRSKGALDKAMLSDSFVRQGRVEKHPRLASHVWNLVAKALDSMGYK